MKQQTNNLWNLVTMLKQKQRSLMYFTSAPLILVLMVLMLLQSLAVMVVARVENYTRSDFPVDFVFGSGTASYQVNTLITLCVSFSCT